MIVDDRLCEVVLCHRTRWITSGSYPIEWQRDFIKKGDAFVIIISLENFIELTAIQFYIAEIERAKNHQYPVFFVYNKSDLWTKRDKEGEGVEKALKIAESFDIPFINTFVVGASNGNVYDQNISKNIERMYYHLIRYIRQVLILIIYVY
jgi:hypothetical protein